MQMEYMIIAQHLHFLLHLLHWEQTIGWIRYLHATPYNRNDVVFNGGIIGVHGTTDLRINTKVELNGATLSMGNDPTSVLNLFLNDQLILSETALVQLANATTIADANNNTNNPVIGTITVWTLSDSGRYLYSSFDDSSRRSN